MDKEILREKICAETIRLLIAERKRQAVSGNALAEKTGLSQALISSMETTSWNPTFDTLLRVADALSIDLGSVITEARANVLKKLPPKN